MRLGALLGERNGHSGVFAVGRHAQPLHFLPLRVYEFDDGVFVVSAANPEHVGAELLSIGGVAIDSLSTRVAELVPRDNSWTTRAARPSFLMASEVLQGLGVDAGAGVVLRPPGGDPVELTVAPVTAAGYADVLDADKRLPRRASVRYLERRDERAWVEQDEDRTIVVGYNVTRGDTSAVAEQIASLAGDSPPRAVVLDLRHNNGGDNTTYGPLLAELERQSRGARLLVLTSRITFSAAMQLVVDLDTRTDAIFVGEPTGASPNHFGDAVSVELPAAGLVARVATISWMTAGEDDDRAAREPDIPVPLRSDDFFAGRDPVLDAALRAAA